MESFITETPVATFIFLITIVTSLYAFSNAEVYGKFMLHPYSISRGERLYALITSGLIHKDWGHLFVNMLSYYFFAFQLEKTFVSLSSWGHVQFGVLYLVSIILSDITSIMKHKEHFWYNSLGASGAVCAVVFSYILFYPLNKMFIFPLPIPIPSVIYGFLFLGYCWYAARNSRDSINHDAHFYGALTGVLLTVIFYPQVASYFIGQLTGSRV
ncbi:rhomboid family intramembrane serine protease [Daejeonella oryzae]|uniref:rhomboid family intramembrane serine protease n=1 Tax=Daejeonella oryzae TaxID=1122943 RepID=UPI0003FAE582|nr:rhomboid family intramembrane serine protease [Daejeonella oryzae]